MTHVWVFGYGSLVNRASIGQTLERDVTDRDLIPATLGGYGRRWNYASPRRTGTWEIPDGRVEAGTIVCLGITATPDETANGAIVRVDERELAELDRREADYDRVDVSYLMVIDVDLAAYGLDTITEPIVTYVPTADAVARYEAAAAAGTAAIERRYDRLVEDGFRDIGGLATYLATTPPPIVPVADVAVTWQRDMLTPGEGGS